MGKNVVINTDVAKNISMKAHSEDSRIAKNGYMERGNDAALAQNHRVNINKSNGQNAEVSNRKQPKEEN